MWALVSVGWESRRASRRPARTFTQAVSVAAATRRPYPANPREAR